MDPIVSALSFLFAVVVTITITVLVLCAALYVTWMIAHEIWAWHHRDGGVCGERE